MAAGKPTDVHKTVFPRAEAISFDVAAFDEALAGQGIKMVHWRSMRCPVGLVDQYDNRRPHDDHSGCSNGFIYTKAGELTVLFTGNNNQYSQSDIGMIDGSSVQVTCQRFYDDTEEQVYIAPFDRLYLAEEGIIVPTWQTFEAHIIGKEKLQYPAVMVQDLIDSDNNRYHQDEDFELENGQIVWKGSRRPTYSPERRRGQICSVRYNYRPYFYVKQLMHEVRVTQAEDMITGERRVFRMPQAMVLQREFVWERSEVDHSEQPDTVGVIKTARDGSYGPR